MLRRRQRTCRLAERSTGDTLLLDAALREHPLRLLRLEPAVRARHVEPPLSRHLRLFAQRDHRGHDARRGRRSSVAPAWATIPTRPPSSSSPPISAELLANRGGARAKIARDPGRGGRTIETAHVYSPGLGWVVTHEDVTEEIASTEIVQKRKRELERQNLRLDAAVNNISQGLCMFDAKGRLVICNAPYARIYNLPEELLKPGTPLEDILGHLFDQRHEAPAATATPISRWRREMISRGEYGKNVHEFNGRTILMQHHPMKDGGWVSTHEDITEQRQQEARIQHLARHDALTELPNRTQFLEEMAAAEAAHRARREDGRALHRPRPLQGGQRHARPRGRRQGAEAGLGPALGHDARDRRPRPARRRRVRRCC